MTTERPGPDRRESAPELKRLLQVVRDQYVLAWRGTHGIGHWARVYTNGIRLAAGTGADPEVLLWFAVFHDACRHNEAHDRGHGGRGAELAQRCRGRYFDLADGKFSLLHEACGGHTIGLRHADVTIQACWDADRLDLARAGIHPDPVRLGSDTARSLIGWASERARNGVVPDFVDRDWATVAPRRPPG